MAGLFRVSDDGDVFTYVDDDGDNVTVRYRQSSDTFLEITNETNASGTSVTVFLDVEDVPEFVARLLELTVKARQAARRSSVV